MLSYEIEKYIKSKNYYLSSEEIIYITNIKLHPQIKEIKYHSDFNYYEMWTSDNYYFKFGCKPYEKALKKVL